MRHMLIDYAESMKRHQDQQDVRVDGKDADGTDFLDHTDASIIEECRYKRRKPAPAYETPTKPYMSWQQVEARDQARQHNGNVEVHGRVPESWPHGSAI